jgi:hypothetical protein
MLTLASSSNPLYLFLLLFLFCFLLPAYFPHPFPPSGNKVVWWLNLFPWAIGPFNETIPCGKSFLIRCAPSPPVRTLRQPGVTFCSKAAADALLNTGTGTPDQL